MYTHSRTHTHTQCLAHYMVPYLFCWESAAPLVCSTKRGQSFLLLHCCLIVGTVSFLSLITSRQAGWGKPWDIATFSLHRQPIMGVNWNSWVDMFAGSAQWGEQWHFLFCLYSTSVMWIVTICRLQYLPHLIPKIQLYQVRCCLFKPAYHVKWKRCKLCTDWQQRKVGWLVQPGWNVWLYLMLISVKSQVGFIRNVHKGLIMIAMFWLLWIN